MVRMSGLHPQHRGSIPRIGIIWIDLVLFIWARTKLSFVLFEDESQSLQSKFESVRSKNQANNRQVKQELFRKILFNTALKLDEGWKNCTTLKYVGVLLEFTKLCNFDQNEILKKFVYLKFGKSNFTN
jgi:hypothetical protein